MSRAVCGGNGVVTGSCGEGLENWARVWAGRDWLAEGMGFGFPGGVRDVSVFPGRGGLLVFVAFRGSGLMWQWGGRGLGGLANAIVEKILRETVGVVLVS